MKAAASIEATGYRSWTRLEEIIRLIEAMKLERIGVAFCIGLSDEAERFVKVLRTTGVKVTAVCCKVCGVSKDEMELPRLHKERPFEASCNHSSAKLQALCSMIADGTVASGSPNNF